MKCVVQFDIDPLPKHFDHPNEAIDYIEDQLSQVADGLTIRWRRDDLYPDNFVSYTREELILEYANKGAFTLQLVGEDKGDIVMAEIATVVREKEYKEDVAEAQAQLSEIMAMYEGKSETQEKEISVSAEGGIWRRKRKKK